MKVDLIFPIFFLSHRSFFGSLSKAFESLYLFLILKHCETNPVVLITDRTYNCSFKLYFYREDQYLNLLSSSTKFWVSRKMFDGVVLRKFTQISIFQEQALELQHIYHRFNSFY